MVWILLLSSHLYAQVILPFGYWKCNSPTLITSDIKNTNAQFSTGTLFNTTVTGTTVSLAVAATTGTYTSSTVDIFSTCAPFTSFVDFSWKTSIPFLKELPTTSESIINYPSVLTTLQTNLIGYWRLNEAVTGTVTGARDFQDFSGSANHAVKTGTITLGASARFLNGISSNNSGGYVDFTGVNTLISNTSSYTIAAWFNISTFTNGCSGSGTYLLDRALSGGGNPLAGICIKTSSYAFETRCDSGASLGQILGSAVVLNTWQHIVIQRDRAAALYRIFTDGVQINTVADGSGCTVTMDPPRLARHATGATQGMTGTADEFMVWNRALSAAEILQLYRRGGNRVQFQFRTCSDSTCSVNPTWLGPDGTSATYFSELNNNSLQLTGLGTV